jgi:flagellar assembly protein FliH
VNNMLCRVYREGEPTPTQVTAWLPKGASAPERVVTSRGFEPMALNKSSEAEARVKAAYDQGRQETEAAANQRAAQKIEPIAASLNRLIQDLAGARKQFRSEAEQDTVKLAIAIARRVLHRELATDPQAILGLVMAAFQKLNAAEAHRLRVSPVDATAIQAVRSRLDLPATLEVTADASLAPGSAIFETSRGEMDASIGTQLAEIDRGFADLMRRGA